MCEWWYDCAHGWSILRHHYRCVQVAPTGAAAAVAADSISQVVARRLKLMSIYFTSLWVLWLCCQALLVAAVPPLYMCD